MKRIKIIKNRVAALCLSLFLALGLIAPAFIFEAKAEALPQVLESSATVADCVMTYYAMSGAAVANTEWINTLYSSLGSDFGTIGQFADQGLLTYVDGVWQPVEQLTQNIASTQAYTELGLNTVFNVSAEEVAAGGGFAASTGAATLAGAVGAVGSVGILPILGGVTAAYWGGIAIGTLINHLVDTYGKNIEQAVPMNVLLSNVPNGANCIVAGDGWLMGRVYYVENCEMICDNHSHFCFSGNPNQVISLIAKYNNNTSDLTYYQLNSNGRYIGGSTGGNSNFSYIFPVWEVTGDYNQFKQNFLNGVKDIPKKISPDIIGPDGNQEGDYNSDTGQYQVPNMLPQINPGTESGKPLSLDDWLAFANGVQNNNNSVSPVPDNSSLFQDLLDAIRQTIPGGGTDPDPGPGTDPGTVPVPTPNPDPDYDVDQPDTNAQESETPETDPDLNPPDFVLPNLMEKFPFCIPNDIATIFGKFRNQTRQAPYISWRFNPPGTPIDYTFNLNLSEFEQVAALLRTLELIAFVVGLAYATRYLIGSS